MITVGRKVPVTTTPTEVYRCRASSVQIMSLRAADALSLVTEGGSVDDGMPMSKDEVVGFSYQDFKGLPPNELFKITSVAAAPTFIYVYGFLKE